MNIFITPTPNAGLDQSVIIPLALEGNNHNKGQTHMLNCVIRIWGYYHLQVLSIIIWGHLPSAGTFHFILWAMTLNEIYNVLTLRIWGHFIQQCGLFWVRSISSLWWAIRIWGFFAFKHHIGGGQQQKSRAKSSKP